LGVSILIARSLLLMIMLALGVAQSFGAGVTLGIMQSGTGGGAAIPPSCNNSLDFTQACNSQYIGAIL
jgi:hypothetical protein